MKKTLVTITATLVCLGALAQGRVNFNNDSLHLVYYTTDSSGLAPGDAGLAGRGPYSTNSPAGATLFADLYSGTAANSLALVKSTTFTGSFAEGRWTAAATTLPSGQPAGGTTFFQVQVYDSRDTNAPSAQANGHYFGTSPVFTAVPGSTTFVNLYQHAPGAAQSTWPDGTFNMDVVAAGARGAIELRVIPEPASLALCGLGAAALLIFRRRK